MKHTPNVCKNCKQSFVGNYCNNCGQSVYTHEIGFHYLWHDFQHGLFHFNNNIFFTLKELFTRPGQTIRDFIEGKRVRYFKPLSFVIVLATVYGLIYHNFNFDIFTDFHRTRTVSEEQFYERIRNWVSNHYAWATLLMLPVITLSSFMVFKKQHRNYMEHLVLNAFICGQMMVLHILSTPILYFYNHTPTFLIFKDLLSYVDFILLWWVYTKFFNQIKFWKTFLLTLGTILLFLLFFLVLAIFFAFIASFIEALIKR